MSLIMIDENDSNKETQSQTEKYVEGDHILEINK